MRRSFTPPTEHTTLPRWSADAAQLCIKIRRSALEAEAARLLGRPLRRAVDFELGLDLGSELGRSSRGSLGLLLAELPGAPSGLAGTSEPYREALERLVISGLVLAQASSLTAEMRDAGAPGPGPSSACRPDRRAFFGAARAWGTSRATPA